MVVLSTVDQSVANTCRCNPTSFRPSSSTLDLVNPWSPTRIAKACRSLPSAPCSYLKDSIWCGPRVLCLPTCHRHGIGGLFHLSPSTRLKADPLLGPECQRESQIQADRPMEIERRATSHGNRNLVNHFKTPRILRYVILKFDVHLEFS